MIDFFLAILAGAALFAAVTALFAFLDNPPVWIDNRIQGGFMRRRGLRGKWLTVYVHTYGGKPEITERLHNHPWRLAVGITLWGWIQEVRRGRNGDKPFARKAPSFALYRRGDYHRVVAAEGCSVFIGICRRKFGAPCYDRPMPKFQGWGHYTEMTAWEAYAYGRGSDLVEYLR